MEEVVLLFNGATDSVTVEMRIADFEALIAGDKPLQDYADCVVRAAYCMVGTGLTVHRLVFFKFRVDAQGVPDRSFNVPLRYLAENAGVGPDLGMGAVRVASRGRCPVPWHNGNLWEPEGEGDSHPAMLAQKAVWRNRLGLKPTAVQLQDEDLEYFTLEEQHFKLEERLTDTISDEDKLTLQQLIEEHHQRLAEVSEKFRADLHAQQQEYLKQIVDCRDEIQRLKTQVRHEQERSRRLQEIMRRDP